MNKYYWYVDIDRKSSPKGIKKCLKDKSGSFDIIRFFEEDGSITKWGQHYDEKNLFGNKKAAEERLYGLQKLYSNFQYNPFVTEDMLIDHLDKFTYIEKKINENLKGYSNFLGIDFCDVGASGIQIRGHHKEIRGYTYGSQPTIKYDFSNYLSCIDEFVEMWKKYDVDSKVKAEKEFIADGEKYGWD